MSDARPIPTNANLQVDEVAHDSPTYHQLRQFRDRILRQPLGLRLTLEDTEGEENDRHFVLSEADSPIGGVIARPEPGATARLRQMWIDPSQSRRGLGQFLLESVLESLAHEGVCQVVLHAREPVIEFYRKCGFDVQGDSFEEIGIPHRRMTKTISPERRSLGDRQ